MTTREYVEPTPLASRLTLPLCLTLALLLCLVLAQALPRHTPAQPAPEPAPEQAALLNAGAIAANEALYGLPKPGALAALGLAEEDLTPHPDGYTGYFCAPPAQALGGEEYSRYLVFDYLDPRAGEGARTYYSGCQYEHACADAEEMLALAGALLDEAHACYGRQAPGLTGGTLKSRRNFSAIRHAAEHGMPGQWIGLWPVGDCTEFRLTLTLAADGRCSVLLSYLYDFDYTDPDTLALWSTLTARGSG